MHFVRLTNFHAMAMHPIILGSELRIRSIIMMAAKSRLLLFCRRIGKITSSPGRTIDVAIRPVTVFVKLTIRVVLSAKNRVTLKVWLKQLEPKH
jgi:hypothetical protein